MTELSPLQHFVDQSNAERTGALDRLLPEQLAAILTAPQLLAQRGQLPPPGGDWTTWLILAGRGSGKTWAWAAWVDACARSVRRARIALVGATLSDARSVMVEGDAGVLAAALQRPRFEPARRLLTWPNGSSASLLGAAEPDSLRGPSFDFAWGDEAAKWNRAADALSNLRLVLRLVLRLALRLGQRPRRLLPTTPRSLPWLKTLAAAGERGARGVVLTRGATAENRINLAPSYLAEMLRDYGGTRLGRQELMGEIIDADGDRGDAARRNASSAVARLDDHNCDLGSGVVDWLDSAKPWRLCVARQH
jgi:phage terminase large subunit-like protein